MGQILLAPKEIGKIIEDIPKKEWNPLNLVNSIAKAQLKKVMTDAPWKIGIGIRFLSEEEYQDLLEEAGLEG